MADSTKLVPNRKPPRAGMGRPKGSQNKATKAIKDMIVAALDKAGGEQYLITQARENPVAFMGLLAKVMPTQIDASVSANIVNRIERTVVRPANPDG